MSEARPGHQPLFTPFRALGYITTDVPFAVQCRGKEAFITVSVGKAWQVYNAATLRLALVGPQMRHSITALAAKGDLTFAAARGAVHAHRRVHRAGVYEGGHAGDVLQLLALGDALLSLGRDGRLCVWTVGAYAAPARTIELPAGFAPTCMAHPPTYVNKILVGAEDGRVVLYNFATGRALHVFGPFGAAVRCLEPSPALDIVGIGLADGRALLHDVRADLPVAAFANAAGAGASAGAGFLAGTAAAAARRAAGGAVTALAFRSGAGPPLLAAAGGAGAVTFWDLEARRLRCVVRDAHDAPVAALHFLPGQPLLISSGGDNALKEWLFDADGAGPAGSAGGHDPGAPPRLLRFRSGHAAPPTLARHYGDGARILSGGQDRAFRLFSAVQDAQSREMSQRHVAARAKRLRVEAAELKLGRLVALDACDVRERDWANVLTAHEGDSAAYVWRLADGALGEHVLAPPPRERLGAPAPPAPVTAVALSRCGNFAFVGAADGALHRYNMQSGLHRGRFARAGGVPAHAGALVGLAPDGANRHLASAGADGAVRRWSFDGRALTGELALGAPVARVASHPPSGLLAAACDDLGVRLVDVEAMRVVRRFRGHADRITDLALSADGRWLLTAAMDNTLRVWDVPGARVLQVLRLGAPVTSLSLAPDATLLATTHVERAGVYLWANQQVFGSGADVVPSNKPLDARLPTVGTGRGAARAAAAAGEGGAATGAARRAAALQAMLRHSAGRDGGANGAVADAADGPAAAALFADDSDLSASDLEVASSDGGGGGSASDSDADSDGAAAAAGPAAGAAYARRDAAGAPAPLAPRLITLSMLPRAQWMNLVHLDAIKARNRPTAPPAKPAAAPFFLPTLRGPGAGRAPVFDLSGGLAAPAGDAPAGGGGAKRKSVAAAAAAAWGAGSGDDDEGGGSGEEEEEDEGGGAPGASRVLRDRAPGAPGGGSRLVALLRVCAAAGDWTSLVAHLRSLPPSELDGELRAMALLEGSPPEAERDVELLLEFLEAQAAAGAGFEHAQAVLRAALAAHGDALAARPALRAAAARLEARLGAGWRRLDALLQGARCAVGLLLGQHGA